MNTPGWFAEFFRDIFAALDGVGYWLLQGVYDIFFAVSSAEILSGNTMNELYGRLQLIFGVFMVFKLSLTALNIIINPDNYKDKQKGAGSIVVRIAVMLVMLTLVIPINIEDTGGNPLYEKMNENGILFGFLYQFQESVISENILGRLILGSSAGSSEDVDSMNDMGGLMTLQVAQAFMTPTLINEDTEITNRDSFTDENTACYDELDQMHYFEPSVKASYLLKHINDTCENDAAGGEVFAMQYTMLGGFIFSIIMSIIVLGFTVDVAVRSIKLAILRIIAPVPIISYITPGAEKDGAFGNWVKTLTSTYIDLFIRLAVISFGAYIIVKLTDGETLNIVTTSTNWFTTGLATIFVIIGILVFMKQAPKFFKDMLGLKGDSSLFGGVGAALGGAALLGGLSGSVISSAKTGFAEGENMGLTKAGSIWRGVRAGAGGLIGGAYAGGKAFMTNDKKIPGSVYSAMQRRTARRGAGSSWLGRVSDLSLIHIFPHRDIVAMKTNNVASYTDVLVTCMRKTPKWILLSEVRSAEAVTAVRNSISSGHNILSTIHADKASAIPYRMYSLLESDIDVDQFLNTIYRYIQLGVHIKAYYSKEYGKFHREVDEVVEFYVDEDNKPQSHILYQKTFGKSPVQNMPSK